ncbi:hypothetical protein E2562_032573, partial [Oryza meyeriana var. granulata]
MLTETPTRGALTKDVEQPASRAPSGGGSRGEETAEGPKFGAFSNRHAPNSPLAKSASIYFWSRLISSFPPSPSSSDAALPPPPPHAHGVTRRGRRSPAVAVRRRLSGAGDASSSAEGSGNDSIMKDYAEASLAIISEIVPKEAIMQLLKQETYSRSECNALIKIIQERVVDSNLSGVDASGLVLPINWKSGRQANIGYSSLSPKGLLPADAGAPTTVTHDRGPFSHKTNKIQSVPKRSYSVASDTPEDSRRVRPKINGNLLEISKFKQVDVIRNHPGDDKKLSDVPLLGTNNLTYSNIISKVESADEKIGTPNKPSAGDDLKNYDSAFLNPCSNKDLKSSFPLKVEPLNVYIPFEQQMMDLSHQKRDHAVCDDSCSVSKLMFKEDIETAL